MGKLFAGLDVSLEKTSVCVVDQTGKTVLETEAATAARAIEASLKPYRRLLTLVAHETGSSAPWLHKELLRRRLPAVCIDARRTRAALSAQRNKTDRNDARDIAVLMSRGFEAATHVKSTEAYRVRLFLTFRSQIVRRVKDIKRVLSMSVRTFGAELHTSGGQLTVSFPSRRHDAFVSELCRTMIECHSMLKQYEHGFDLLAAKLAQSDPICRRLMTAPGVGPIVALTFRAAVDDPTRFRSSDVVAAHFGLTPKRRQSGQSDFSGHISLLGDGSVRSALYGAAGVMLVHCKAMTPLKVWGLKLRAQKGFKYASIACARKLAVILHRMWITETDFKSTNHALSKERAVGNERG